MLLFLHNFLIFCNFIRLIKNIYYILSFSDFNEKIIKYQINSEILIDITSLTNGNEVIIKWNKIFYSTNYMIYNCYDIISLDLSNFNISSVNNMQSMLSGCSSLISINSSKFGPL